MKNLNHPFLKIETVKGTFYGGNQSWFSYKFLQKTGCGVIGAANVLLHMKGEKILSEEEYMTFAKKLWKNYLPVIPGFGMNGLTLMVGLNRYFYHHKIPYAARWTVSSSRMIPRIDQMLAKDLPVILAVGPNFPKFWGKQALNFYTKTQTGDYIPTVKTRAHFVTVTGREGAWLKISSWGKEYYIDIREYRSYVKNYSCPLVSNIICIKKRKTIK
jgi:hypothetical protein